MVGLYDSVFFYFFEAMKRPTLAIVKAYFSGKKLPRKKKKSVLTYQRCSDNNYVADQAFALFKEELSDLA